MITSMRLSADEAEFVIDATARCAKSMQVPQNIAIVDPAGHLIAFRRMDGANFTSIEIAIAKAFTAAGAGKPTADIGPATQPGKPGYGIQSLHSGRFTTLPGGIPFVVDGTIVGAIGVSSGTTDQDQHVAQAGARAFRELLAEQVVTENSEA